MRSRPPKAAPAGPNVVTGNIDAKAADYRANKWAFTEGFYTEESHRELVEGWPPRSYFAPMGNVLKSLRLRHQVASRPGRSRAPGPLPRR